MEVMKKMVKLFDVMSQMNRLSKEKLEGKAKEGDLVIVDNKYICVVFKNARWLSETCNSDLAVIPLKFKQDENIGWIGFNEAIQELFEIGKYRIFANSKEWGIITFDD